MNNEQKNTSVINTRQFKLLESIFIGSTAGAAEVIANHPFLTLKNCLQNGDKLSLDPRFLYRGIQLNFFSMVPITAVQVTTSYFIQAKCFKEETQKTQAISAFAGGCASAIIASPTELVINQQQKYRQTFLKALNGFKKNVGLVTLHTGITCTAIRNGIFTYGYFSLFPNIKEMFQPFNFNEATKTVSAGILAGIISTVPSHIFDSIKNKQQYLVDERKVNITEAAKLIYNERGIKSFFKGVTPRGAKIVSAVTIMGYVKKNMDEWLHSEREEQNKHGTVPTLKKP